MALAAGPCANTDPRSAASLPSRGLGPSREGNALFQKLARPRRTPLQPRGAVSDVASDLERCLLKRLSKPFASLSTHSQSLRTRFDARCSPRSRSAAHASARARLWTPALCAAAPRRARTAGLGRCGSLSTIRRRPYSFDRARSTARRRQRTQSAVHCWPRLTRSLCSVGL